MDPTEGVIMAIVDCRYCEAQLHECRRPVRPGGTTEEKDEPKMKNLDPGQHRKNQRGVCGSEKIEHDDG